MIACIPGKHTLHLLRANFYDHLRSLPCLTDVCFPLTEIDEEKKLKDLLSRGGAPERSNARSYLKRTGWTGCQAADDSTSIGSRILAPGEQQVLWLIIIIGEQQVLPQPRRKTGSKTTMTTDDDDNSSHAWWFRFLLTEFSRSVPWKVTVKLMEPSPSFSQRVSRVKNVRAQSDEPATSQQWTTERISQATCASFHRPFPLALSSSLARTPRLICYFLLFLKFLSISSLRRLSCCTLSTMSVGGFFFFFASAPTPPPEESNLLVNPADICHNGKR